MRFTLHEKDKKTGKINVKTGQKSVKYVKQVAKVLTEIFASQAEALGIPLKQFYQDNRIIFTDDLQALIGSGKIQDGKFQGGRWGRLAGLNIHRFSSDAVITAANLGKRKAIGSSAQFIGANARRAFARASQSGKQVFTLQNGLRIIVDNRFEGKMVYRKGRDEDVEKYKRSINLLYKIPTILSNAIEIAEGNATKESHAGEKTKILLSVVREKEIVITEDGKRKEQDVYYALKMRVNKKPNENDWFLYHVEGFKLLGEPEEPITIAGRNKSTGPSESSPRGGAQHSIIAAVDSNESASLEQDVSSEIAEAKAQPRTFSVNEMIRIVDTAPAYFQSGIESGKIQNGKFQDRRWGRLAGLNIHRFSSDAVITAANLGKRKAIGSSAQSIGANARRAFARASQSGKQVFTLQNGLKVIVDDRFEGKMAFKRDREEDVEKYKRSTNLLYKYKIPTILSNAIEIAEGNATKESHAGEKTKILLSVVHEKEIVITEDGKRKEQDVYYALKMRVNKKSNENDWFLYHVEGFKIPAAPEASITAGNRNESTVPSGASPFGSGRHSITATAGSNEAASPEQDVSSEIAEAKAQPRTFSVNEMIRIVDTAPAYFQSGIESGKIQDGKFQAFDRNAGYWFESKNIKWDKRFLKKPIKPYVLNRTDFKRKPLFIVGKSGDNLYEKALKEKGNKVEVLGVEGLVELDEGAYSKVTHNIENFPRPTIRAGLAVDLHELLANAVPVSTDENRKIENSQKKFMQLVTAVRTGGNDYAMRITLKRGFPKDTWHFHTVESHPIQKSTIAAKPTAYAAAGLSAAEVSSKPEATYTVEQLLNAVKVYDWPVFQSGDEVGKKRGAFFFEENGQARIAISDAANRSILRYLI